MENNYKTFQNIKVVVSHLYYSYCSSNLPKYVFCPSLDPVWHISGCHFGLRDICVGNIAQTRLSKAACVSPDRKESHKSIYACP